MTAIETHEPTRERRWLTALFLGAASMSLAMVTASTMGTLVAAEAWGAAWSGLPSAAGVVGTAIGAAVLSAVMARRGRRAGLVTGYAAGTAGGVLAMFSTTTPWVLVAGMALLGMGNAAAQLSRYAAAEVGSRRSGTALAVVVWAGTLGAVGGPLLLAPMSAVASAAGYAPGAGIFALGAGAVALATLAAASLPRTDAVAPRAMTTHTVAELPVTPLLPVATSPTPVVPPSHRAPMRLALATMLAAQAVMTMIMTAAPVAVHQHGHGLHTVGAMISVHTFGMFALAPLSGLLCDRFGGRALIATGLALLTFSSITVVIASGGPALALVLFALGYGWNLAYIGASHVISGNLPPIDQVRLEGTVETRVWGGSAAATVASTLLFATGGYGLVATVSLAILIVPVIALYRTVDRPTAS
ncbi:MFS transporter [Nocardia sp. NPDC050406]|uniref:MFS transporter n=1 Tax=Nocardia sp. NPDC050406 TaxID=3364318 RepID=UPI00379FBB12